jgi:phage repressor protein C with HTH and peptisase S24 domain
MRFGIAVVEGHSMIPTYAPAERVLIWYGAKYKVSDVIIWTNQERLELKRITRIEDDLIFVEGDNKEVSVDSRNYGPIRSAQIIGKVVYRLPQWLTKRISN